MLKVLNVSHGELLMLGGYAAFWAFKLLAIDPFVSLLGVIPLMFILGVLLHFGLFSRVVKFDEEHRIKNSLLIGFGLTLIFQTLAIRLFTADDRSIPTAYSSNVLIVLGVRLPIVRLSGLIIGTIVVIALQIFLRRTYWGKAIRATAEDWQTASSDRNQHPARLSGHIRARFGAGRAGGDAGRRRLQHQSQHRAGLDAQGADRRRAGGIRQRAGDVHRGHLARHWPKRAVR